MAENEQRSIPDGKSVDCTADMGKRIVYMGTPDFAVPPLRRLAEEGYRIVGCVTQPDKPKGRGKTLLPTPVKEEALKYGIPVYQPVKVREDGFFEILQALSPDIIIVAAFGQIIPKKILDLPQYGCINIHASLLPKYRGAAPIQHALIDGEEQTGVTIMQMGEGLDTGDMLTRTVVPILAEDTGGSLFDKLAEAGAQLLIDSLPKIFAGETCPVPQPEQSPTPYASMIRKEMGNMDFTQDAVYLERLVRGLSPWPGAYTYIDGKMLKIWKSKCPDAPQPAPGSILPAADESARPETVPADKAAVSPGTILTAGKDGILVQCGTGSLLLTEVQIEGKKRMEADAFLRGYHVKEGAVLPERRND